MEPEYEEFSYLADNASEVGLAWHAPVVERRNVAVREQRKVSAIVWGKDEPEIVLVHGGGQNAHTWDTVALALDRPLVALDLPGHGHSSWVKDEQVHDPTEHARDVALAIKALAPSARLVVGMSLGGLTTIALTSVAPEVVKKLAIVDATPGVGERGESNVARFLGGPREFKTFDDLLAYTVAHNPTRSVSSLRRGVLHNAHARPDGIWTWRHQASGARRAGWDRAALWEVLGEISVPTILYRGGRSTMVSDADVAEFEKRLPAARVVVIPGAGHSIQGDQPLLLAEQLRSFLDE